MRTVHHKRDPYDVYIGRPSKWGNPFAIGRDGSREQVIQKHADWLLKQTELVAARHELTGKILGCWCAPNACHGDTLDGLANGTVVVLTSSRALEGKAWAWYWILDGLQRIMREYPGPYLLIEGCAKGGDHMAVYCARVLGWNVLHVPCTPPEWCKYGKSAGHRRNARMLAYRPDVVIAFPWGEARGTRGCVAQARKLGLRTMVMTRLRRRYADPTQDRRKESQRRTGNRSG